MSMTDKEMRKLSRGDLLQILLEQSRENEHLKRELTDVRAVLDKKILDIEQAGSIAEASLQLNGVFEAAQRACKQYTDNIAFLSQRQEEICSRRSKESQERSAQLLADAQKKAKDLESAAKESCEKMIQKAKKESQQYWDEVHGKLSVYLEEHKELKKILSLLSEDNQDGDYEAK